MESWYETVRGKTESIFQKITQHNFIKGLLDGSLPEDIFQFYVNQDSLYLATYKKVLSTVAIKCIQAEETQFFLESSTGILEVENALHETFLKREYHVNEPSPTCQLYISYLTHIVETASIEVGLAAVLPCFTIYKEVGDYILQHQTQHTNNPYQNWINTYAGEEFGKSVKKAIEITNKYANHASNQSLLMMEKAFIKASKLEWMFWDSAYQKEQWKI